MHTVGPGISCETVKNVQNEKCTLYDLEYGKKTLKNMENEKHTLSNLDYGVKQ